MQTKVQTLKDFERKFKNQEYDWKEALTKINFDPVKEGWKKGCDGKLDKKENKDIHVKIFTKKLEDSPLLYTYQVVQIKGVELEKIVNFSIDFTKRKEWDKNILDGKYIETFGNFSEIFYLACKMPFMMSNRDFLFERHRICNKDHPEIIKKYNLPDCKEKYYMCLVKSIELEEVPHDKKFIRAEMDQFVQFKQIDPETVEFVAYSHADLKGSIPHFLMNAGAVNSAQEVLKDMFKNYREQDAKGNLK